MKLHTICNVKTLLTESEDGPIAAFILPSSTLSKASPYYCKVNARTGHLYPGKEQVALMPSTTLEMDWAAYRYGTIDNLNLKRTLTAQNKLQLLLQHWMSTVPADNIKLYFGGDMADATDIFCISKAAKSVPEKTIYLQTTLKHQLDYTLVAENIIVGLMPNRAANLMYTTLPTVVYSRADGVDEFHHMPKKGSNTIIWHITDRCADALASKLPQLDQLILTI